MMRTVYLAFCLLASVAAQIPDYSCTNAGTNCNSQTYATRGDVIGCLYFCNLDANTDSKLSRSEYDASFIDCAGSVDGICEEANFVASVTLVLPVCQSEASGMHREFAAMDGDTTTFLIADVQVIWDTCLAAQNYTSTEHVLPYGFAPIWAETWKAVEDPTCTLPYP